MDKYLWPTPEYFTKTEHIMRTRIGLSSFAFEYTGSKLNETTVIAEGYKRLSGEELLIKIVNQTIYGDYLMGYKFATDVYENGTAEGINNVGTRDFGLWKIDYENDTFQINWKNGWFDTLTRAYEVNGNIEFYDVDTGLWRTTFKSFYKWSEE